MANPDTMNIMVNTVFTGWICPNCGRGVNPNARYCKCVKKGEYKVEELYDLSKFKEFAKNAPTDSDKLAKDQGISHVHVDPVYSGKTPVIGSKEATEKYKRQVQEHIASRPPFVFKGFPVGKEHHKEEIEAEPDCDDTQSSITNKDVPLHYGCEVRIGNANSPYFGQHGSYTRNETTEEGMKKVITMFKSGDQVKVTDAEIEVVNDGS